MSVRFLRRVLVVGLGAGALALAAPAQASTTYSGSILLGHPVTGVVGGVTENLDGCTPGGTLEGIDGVWFDISGQGGLPAVLSSAATLDADVWFYTAGCGFINDSTFAQTGLGEDEVGNIPVSASFAVVDGFAGTGDFALVVG